MASLVDLVLSDGETVEAVGWLDGSSNLRSLQVSPTWRPDRRTPVKGGSVDVYLLGDPTASIVDEATRVRVVGEWRDSAIHNARLALAEADNISDGGGRTPQGPSGSRLTSPSPAEKAV